MSVPTPQNTPCHSVGVIADQHLSPSENGAGEGGSGGRGGRGGQGGEGGEGGGDGAPGKPGSPGKPGELGEKGERGDVGARGRPGQLSPLATVIALGPLAIAIVGGIVWLTSIKFDVGTKLSREDAITMNSTITALKSEYDHLKADVFNLNTPLAQRVFSLEARLNEIARIQTEVRASVTSIDQNGSSQNKALVRELNEMRAAVAAQNVRCQDMNRALQTLQTESSETKIRLQYLIEAVAPHPIRKRGE